MSLESRKLSRPRKTNRERRQTPAVPGGRGLRTGAGFLLHLRLEEFDHTCSSHPLEWIPFPASLNHVPHAIRDLGMDRPWWSVVLKHREDYCSLHLSSERWLSGKNLETAPVDEYLEVRRRTKVQLTSQASIPNANISVALVVRA